MPAPRPVIPLWSPPPLVAGVVTAAHDFVAAASCLLTWLQPTRLDQRMVAHLVLVMPFEFMQKVLALLGLGLLYSLFAGGFSLAEHTWWPFTTFWILIANRILSVVVSPAEDLRDFPVVHVMWATGAALYLCGVALTSTLPLPRLGVTPAVVALQGFHSSGLWVEEPWRPLAFGVFYFGLFGVAELLIAMRMANRSPAYR